jgi:DNA polymerase I-like protein with 3'-5' exonuclease and polymerase domains
MTTANGSVPRSGREAALYFLDRGRAPVPVPLGERYPKGINGWEQGPVTRDSVDAFFPADVETGCGLLTGEPSGGLADADADCDEAVRAARVLLPATGWTSGRQSHPDAHRWYQVSHGTLTEAAEKFFDPTVPNKKGDGDHAGLLIELRYTGSYTLAFSAKHFRKGEPVTFSFAGSPAEVDAAELRAAVKRVAAASLLAKYWPGGARHDAALALAGGLLRAGWATDDAERFIEAVAVAAGDEEVRDRVRAVKDTAEALSAGKNVIGWPKLAAAVGKEVVAKVREWLGIRPERPSAMSPVRKIDPYQPFPVEALPAPIAEYIRQGALALGCDPAYLALPALAVVASAIGNTRTIRLKRGWEEPAIVWSAIVGDSGTLKSPAYLKAVAHLYRLQKKLLDQYKQDLARYVEELEEYKAEKRQAKEDGTDPGDPPEVPVRRRVVCSDTTIEKLAEILEDNPRGTLVARDELAGWLGSFGRYKSKQGGTDLPNWLEMFRAGTVIVDRKTGDRTTLYVPGAAASVTGGIQPGVLTRALTPEFLDAGLAARLLMAMPPKLPKQWTEVEVIPDVEQAYKDSLDRLLELDFDTKDGEKVPHVLDLSPDGKAAWVAFYNAWAREQAAAEGDLAAAFSKLEAYAARFALLHHVVTHVHLDVDDRRPVGVKSVEAGVTLCRWFAAEARRIYSILSESDDQRDARRLVEFIRSRGGRLTARALQKSNSRKYPDADQARAALDKLVQAGLGYWTRPEVGPKGGQPAQWFVLSTDGTTDPTDTTPEGEDDADGLGARHYPPPPDTTPQNSQEKPGSVGRVGSAIERNGVYEANGAGPPTGVVLSGASGVVTGDRGDDDGPVDASVSYVLVTAQTDVPMVVTAVGESSLVGLDTETTGLDPRTDRVRLLSLATDNIDGNTTVYVVDCFAVDPSPLWEALSTVTVVGHNLVFDIGFLARLGFEPGVCRDTLLMSQVLYAGDRSVKSHKLADCCQRELGEAISKEEQASDWSSLLTPDQLRYAALDASLTRRLHDVLVPKLAEAKLTATTAIENRALPAVAWLASAGVAFDKNGWTARAADAQGEADQLAAELDRVAPPKAQAEMFESGWKWDSPQHVAEALKAVGCAVADTDDDTLAALDHPLARLLRGYRAAKKLATTYGSKWLKDSYRDGRVYAGWRQLGANSGRMACAAPNLQNLPRDARYRRCFVAPPGRVLVKADYSQIELRIAAKVANEPAMIAAYRRGDDLHALTARVVLGKPDVDKSDRQLAKSVNFGLLYGMGAKAFRAYARSNYGVELTEEQTEQYRRAFFAAYPALRRWHSKVGGTQDRPIDTRTLAGRRCLNVVRFSEKLNLGVQGTGADGLKKALALLWERRAECPGARPVLAVHDEIVVECDTDRAAAAAAWLKQAMLDGMAPLVAPVPVEIEVTVSPTWGG